MGWLPTIILDIVSLFICRGETMDIKVTNGISRTAVREDNDYYATDPRAMQDLLYYEQFNTNIWECACGEGNLSEVLKANGYNVYSTDLIDRGYQDNIIDFLHSDIKFKGDIITNPPFKYTNEFILKALDSIEDGSRVAMFLKINYLAGLKRFNEIYNKYPPSKVYVFSGRYACSKNNTPEGYKNGAMDYMWVIWEKGVKGCTYLKWIDTKGIRNGNR